MRAMPDPVTTPPTSPARPAAPSPARAGRGERALAGLIAGSCLAVLSVAAFLNPDAAGHGTHEQLGMPACAWAIRFGAPCPTCGMTTSFAHAAEANWFEAIVTQPAGAALAAGAAVAFWAASHVLVFGSRLAGPAGTMLRKRVVWTAVALGVAAWGYKIAVWTPQAPGLTTPFTVQTPTEAGQNWAWPPIRPVPIQPIEIGPDADGSTPSPNLRPTAETDAANRRSPIEP